MHEIVKLGLEIRKQRVGFVGTPSDKGLRTLGGLKLAVETIQLDKYHREQFIKSLLPVKPKETGLVSMTEMMAAALKDPDNTAIVFDDDTLEDVTVNGTSALVEYQGSDAMATTVPADSEALAVAMEACGVRVFRTMREAVRWVNSETSKL